MINASYILFIPLTLNLFMPLRGFPSCPRAKNPPGNAGDAGSTPGSGRLLGEEMATYSSILAWEIP